MLQKTKLLDVITWALYLNSFIKPEFSYLLRKYNNMDPVFSLHLFVLLFSYRQMGKVISKIKLIDQIGA